MSGREYRKIVNARDALAVLSLRVYEEFGDEALPIIADVCYQLGRSIGAQMRGDLADYSLGSAGQAFVDAAQRRGSKVEIIEKSAEVFHAKTGEGYRCVMGVENTDRRICEAVMGTDLGILEAAAGASLELDIRQSMAANDPCCEMIFRLKGR